MCSITGIFDITQDAAALRRRALELSRRQRHRGPDWSGVFACESAILAHERLAIVDVEHGAQPLVSADGALVLAVNGEIYNHVELRADLERIGNDSTFDLWSLVRLVPESVAALAARADPPHARRTAAPAASSAPPI